MAMLKTYRVVLLTTSVAHNLVTGTTATSTGPFGAADVGRSMMVQNQSTGAVDIWVGPQNVVVGAAAASTSTGPFGIKVAQNGTYFLDGWQMSGRGVDANEVWVVSTSSNAIAVGQLHKAV